MLPFWNSDALWEVLVEETGPIGISPALDTTSLIGPIGCYIMC